GAASLPRSFLDDQARITRRKVPPDLHASALFLQEADDRGGVITPTAVHGLDQLLLRERSQCHRDLEFPRQLGSQSNVLAHHLSAKEAFVPIWLKIATEPTFRQTMNAASATAKGTTAGGLPQGFGIRACLHSKCEQLGDRLAGDCRDSVVNQFTNRTGANGA